MPGIRDLLVDLDRRWPRPLARRLPLRFLGATALVLQTDFDRGTKDGDVLEAVELGPHAATLRGLAGPGSDLAARHGVYLDLVAAGLPFLPQAPTWHPLAVLTGLSNLDVAVLDVVDVVVTKLKRFSASDQADVAAMVDRDLVPHDALVARFRSAVELYVLDARASDLPRYVANLHRVERDLLLVSETEIVLPSWI